MSETKVSKPDPAQIRERRAALDRVLAAAKTECNDMIRIYDCAVWLLYACARDDARELAEEPLEDEDEQDALERAMHSPKDELVETMDMVHDDRDAAVGIWEDAMELGKLLDPGFDQPIIGQDDWLNPNLLAESASEKPASTR